ncbi:MAG: TetR/AcrR family transcriptional regulator [Archangium gephyra]|uniref:TetR/AcrR family transcriptional regulator n=1 Tax=Archangium gephyra TaxID=48 RepID=A0A2W5SV73_9BACT|nr:MAG: TetR/AcrR family transcriptional regulator [Archangium gephyra]
MSNQRAYHHGDLRNALLRATIDLVREHGARGFSVAEAARRAGVSSAAPYRHFADRDAMLAAAALQAFLELDEEFDRLELGPDLATSAAQIATSYLTFAQADPARFEILFSAGLDKAAHPELLEQAASIQRRLERAIAPFVPASDLVGRGAELWSLAHGIATLNAGGNLQHVIAPDRIMAMTESAAGAWAAGVTA